MITKKITSDFFVNLNLIKISINSMKTKFFIYPQLNYLTRTAIEVKILFAVCLSKKQALTEGKNLACEDKCSKKIGAVLVQQADRRSFEASEVSHLFIFIFCVIIKTIRKLRNS